MKKKWNEKLEYFFFVDFTSLFSTSFNQKKSLPEKVFFRKFLKELISYKKSNEKWTGDVAYPDMQK